MSGWYASDSARWPGRLERLRKLGPLDEDDAREDLRYLESEHRLWMRSEGRSGQRFPGRPELAKRWGWTEWKTRALLSADDWHDPQQPVSSAELRQPAARKPPAFHQETASPTTVEPAQSAQKPPAFRQPAASVPPAPPPHARSSSAPEHRTPDTESNNTRANHPPAGWVLGPVHDPDVVATWDTIRGLSATAAEVLEPAPTVHQARTIQQALERHGADKVLEVARWVWLGADDWTRRHQPDPAWWLDPQRFASSLAKAKAAQATPTATGPPRAESWQDRERREIAERNARHAEHDKRIAELKARKEAERERKLAERRGHQAGPGLDPGRVPSASDLVGPVLRNVGPVPARASGS